MRQDIEDAIKEARKPGPMTCPVSGEELFSPMDKLSICLYGKSTEFLEDNSLEAANLLRLVNKL